MTDQASADNTIAFLRGLRAVRHFRPEPVPQQVVDDVLEVARWSGSARNVQPWEFVVIRHRGTLEALASLEGYAGHMAGAAIGIVLVMAGEHEEQETYDEGRLSERIMLAAAAHGVGSSIGWFSGGGRAAAKTLLGIPQQRLVRTAISLGNPDEEARSKRNRAGPARKPMADLLHEEKYQTPSATD